MKPRAKPRSPGDLGNIDTSDQRVTVRCTRCRKTWRGTMKAARAKFKGHRCAAVSCVAEVTTVEA